ncbi:hypothetical protein [uncultured Methanobrevibacter sp.]|uniref:hypothetical protein n=2 Tax=uncultured Methanobrevibacter sp. TaxID=253161 RepID=UPI0025EE87D1|nr:hypothetical protein [uncultured Methanobrevibacter sp.]
MDYKKLIKSSMDNYIEKIRICEDIYCDVLQSIPDDFEENIFKIQNKELFNKIIMNFGPTLNQDKAEVDLMTIYDIAVHTKTKALIISNKGANLYSLTEKFETPHLVRHIGIFVYMPGMGVEYANAGIVGNIYDDKFVFRTESACSPSFLFGSQRCNCYYQWKNIRELAGFFNQIEMPDISDGDEFERWVQGQYSYENGKHIYHNVGKIGFLMLHIDSQNGMGSGFTENEFVFDLSERAAIRHRGQYTSEQTYKTTMYGGFTTLGLDADPRGKNGGIGYTLTPVILDYLNTNKNLIMLTNNPQKMKLMKDFGYNIKRVKTLGAICIAGSSEAIQRGTDFNHLDINGNLISFKEEFERIKKEIKEIIND